MKSFVFITTEGFTYQPDSQSSEPDIENCQVLGYGDGKNPQEAFNNCAGYNPTGPSPDPASPGAARQPPQWPAGSRAPSPDPFPSRLPALPQRPGNILPW